jgi:hypothetical protein
MSTGKHAQLKVGSLPYSSYDLDDNSSTHLQQETIEEEPQIVRRQSQMQKIILQKPSPRPLVRYPNHHARIQPKTSIPDQILLKRPKIAYLQQKDMFLI